MSDCSCKGKCPNPKKPCSCECHLSLVQQLTAERDALRAENTKLKIELRINDGFIASAFEQRDRYREALEKIIDYGRPLEAPRASYAVCEINDIAKAALGETK